MFFLILVLLFPFFAHAGGTKIAQGPSPSYWRSMISSLPPEGVYDATFKEKDIVNTEAAPLFKKAVDSFKQKLYPKTLEQLKEIISRFPKDNTTQYAYFLMADCYAKMAENSSTVSPKESVSAYLQSISRYPGSDEAPRGLYQAGKGLFAQRFYYEALAQMNRLSKRYPKSPYTLKGTVAKGIIYFHQKKYRMAESTLRAVVSNKESAEEDKRLSLLWLANTLHMEGMYKEARDHYVKVEGQWPEYLKQSRLSLLSMGENQILLGEYQDGRRLFDLYSKLYANQGPAPVVTLRKADTFLLNGKRKEAVKLYSKVVTLYPAHNAALIGKARILEDKIVGGDPIPATQALQDLLSSKGDMAIDAAIVVAEAYKNAGIPHEAVEAYRAILSRFAGISKGELKKNFMESLRAAVIDSYKKGDYLAVLKLYHEENRMLKGVRDPEFVKMIGDGYMEVGLPSKAVSLYETALYPYDKAASMSGAHIEETLFKAIKAYLKLGRKEGAARLTKRLYAEFPRTKFKKELENTVDTAKVKERKDITAAEYLDMAKKHLESKRHKEAVDYFKKVINSKEPLLLGAAYTGLGDSYFEMGKYKDAIDAYEVAKSEGGETGRWATYRIGESCLSLGDLEKARTVFTALGKDDKGVYRKMAAEGIKEIELRRRGND